MPLPSVEPKPPLFSAFRLVVALEEQDASYLAASLRIANFSMSVYRAIRSLYVLGLVGQIKFLNNGGRRGIRTLGRLLTYARVPGVCLKPLGHPSAM